VVLILELLNQGELEQQAKDMLVVLAFKVVDCMKAVAVVAQVQLVLMLLGEHLVVMVVLVFLLL